jgi:hypothetical protein
MAESNEKDLVIAALRQRIGELVSAYETDIAVIRAGYTKLSEEFENISKALADQKINTSDNETESNLFQPVTKFNPTDAKKKE